MFPANQTVTDLLRTEGLLHARMEPKIKFRKQKTFRNDVIATAKATGEILQFWNALLVGDDVTILGVIDDPENAYLVDAVYDTSDIDEWKNFRFNYRNLSMSVCLTIYCIIILRVQATAF